MRSLLSPTFLDLFSTFVSIFDRMSQKERDTRSYWVCRNWRSDRTPSNSWRRFVWKYPGEINVPTQTGKPRNMGRTFPVREFWTDWKSQGKSHKILRKSRDFKQMLFIFKCCLNELCIICSNISSFQLGGGKKNVIKILEKSGNFVSPRKWEPCSWASSEYKW